MLREVPLIDGWARKQYITEILAIFIKTFAKKFVSILFDYLILTSCFQLLSGCNLQPVYYIICIIWPLQVQGVDLVSLTRRCQNVYTIFSFRHNDLAWNIRQFIHNKLKTVNFSSDLTQVSPWGTSKWSHTDIPRLVRGKIGAQVGIRNGAVQISNYQVTSKIV